MFKHGLTIEFHGIIECGLRIGPGRLGAKDPHRIAMDLAFAVLRFYPLGSPLQNY